MKIEQLKPSQRVAGRWLAVMEANREVLAAALA